MGKPALTTFLKTIYFSTSFAVIEFTIICLRKLLHWDCPRAANLLLIPNL